MQLFTSLNISIGLLSSLVFAIPASDDSGYEVDQAFEPKCKKFSLQTGGGKGPFIGYEAEDSVTWIDKAGDLTAFDLVKETKGYRLKLKNGKYLGACSCATVVNFKDKAEASTLFTFESAGDDFVYLKSYDDKYISGGQKPKYKIRPVDTKTTCSKLKIVCYSTLAPYEPTCEQFSIKGAGGFIQSKDNAFTVANKDCLTNEFIAIKEKDKYRLRLRSKTTEERWLNFCSSGVINIKTEKLDSGLVTFWKCSQSGGIYIQGDKEKWLSVADKVSPSAERTDKTKVEIICHGVSPYCNTFRFKTWENNFLGPDQAKKLFVPKNQCCPSEFATLETTDFKTFGLKFPAGYLDFCTSTGNPARVKPAAGQFTFEKLDSGKYKVKQKELYLSGGMLKNLQQYNVRGKPAPTKNCEEFEIVCGGACEK